MPAMAVAYKCGPRHHGSKSLLELHATYMSPQIANEKKASPGAMACHVALLITVVTRQRAGWPLAPQPNSNKLFLFDNHLQRLRPYNSGCTPYNAQRLGLQSSTVCSGETRAIPSSPGDIPERHTSQKTNWKLGAPPATCELA